MLFIVIIFAFGVSGCSVLTPYKTEFQCKSPYKGKCVSVKEAYAESKSNVPLPLAAKDGKKMDVKAALEAAPVDSTEGYRDSLQRELSDLLDAPVTPVIVPPKVLRMLVFPYPEKSVLYMPRYIFLMVGDPEWVIGNYLVGKERD